MQWLVVLRDVPVCTVQACRNSTTASEHSRNCATLGPLAKVAMGRFGGDKKNRRGDDQKGRGDKTKKQDKAAVVPKYEFWAKNKLASYPSEDGTCLYFGKGQGAREFFALDSICQSRSAKNEELCKRIGMGLALDAATLHTGAQLLQKRVAEDLPDELQKGPFAKTGIPKLMQELSSEAGSNFVEALAVLNVGKTGQPSEKAVKKAMAVFVEYLQEEDGTRKLRHHLSRLASDAAALYLFAMTFLKDFALFTHPKDWAGKVEAKQSEAVKKWLKDPKNSEKLQKALVAELMAKVENNEAAPGKKRKASDSSSAAPAKKTAKKSDSEAAASGASGSEAGSVAGSSAETSTGAAAASRAASSSGSGSSAPKKAKKGSKKEADKQKDKKKVEKAAKEKNTGGERQEETGGEGKERAQGEEGVQGEEEGTRGCGEEGKGSRGGRSSGGKDRRLHRLVAGCRRRTPGTGG